MKKKKGRRICFLLLFLFLGMGSVTGCSYNQGVPQWSGSGFLRKQFLEYRTVAILPFEGDDSVRATAAFGESFSKRFPQISILPLRAGSDVLKGQILSPGQLDEATRVKIGRALNAQALILGNVYYPSITSWFLQVEIVGAETGEVMGRSMVEINYMGAEGVQQGARLAVERFTLW